MLSGSEDELDLIEDSDATTQPGSPQLIEDVDSDVTEDMELLSAEGSEVR